jgi:hypothetical protein
MIVRVMASRTASAPCPASADPFLMRASWPWSVAWQGQQQGEARRALHQRANGGTAETHDEIPFPVARHGAISCLRRTFADHDLGRDEGLAPAAGARPRRAQRPAAAQAGRQLAAQSAPPLHEQRLVDRLMADAPRRIIREVDRQAAGDLLRAPGVGPSPRLPRSMPPGLPGHRRARNSGPAWRDDAASSRSSA